MSDTNDGVLPVRWLALLVIASVATAQTASGQGVVSVPPELRKTNFGGGSCVYASCQTVAWYQKIRKLEELHKRYSGGSYPSRLRPELGREGVDFAMTTRGDENFLRWAQATGRPVAVSWYAAHMTTWLGTVKDSSGKEQAVILDNNNVSRLIYRDFDRWLAEWRSYGGWAVSFPNDPPPAPVAKLSRAELRELQGANRRKARSGK